MFLRLSRCSNVWLIWRRAILPPAALACAVVLLVAAAWAAEPKAATAEPAPLDTPAAEAELVLGDGYTMEVRRGAVAKPCGGELVKATDKWVVLRSRNISQTCEGIPYLMDLPLIGDWFCRYTDDVLVTDLWIPREAATLRSHTPGAKPAAVKPFVADEPPILAMCRVSAVTGGKVDHFIRDLTVVGGDGVTLAGTDDGHPLQIARHDLLSIEIKQSDQKIAAQPAGDRQRE
jgi:hypothetical protein